MLLADDVDVLGAIFSSVPKTKIGLFGYDVLQTCTEVMTEQANGPCRCLHLLMNSVVLSSSFDVCFTQSCTETAAGIQGQPATQHCFCRKAYMIQPYVACAAGFTQECREAVAANQPELG